MHPVSKVNTECLLNSLELGSSPTNLLKPLVGSPSAISLWFLLWWVHVSFYMGF